MHVQFYNYIQVIAKKNLLGIVPEYGLRFVLFLSYLVTCFLLIPFSHTLSIGGMGISIVVKYLHSMLNLRRSNILQEDSSHTGQLWYS